MIIMQPQNSEFRAIEAFGAAHNIRAYLIQCHELGKGREIQQ